jgi:hypothetical protein
MKEDLGNFFEEIEKLSLPDLEQRIKEQFKIFKRSRNYKDEKLDLYLGHRKYLINSNWKFTPTVVCQIERINRILTRSTALVLERTRLLYQQMSLLKREGDNFLDDFQVEGTVSVSFNGEKSVLTFDEDENNGQSDYVAMADILDYAALAFEHLREFNLSWTEDPAHRLADEERLRDNTLAYNWNIGLLSAPELSHIDYFCYASHRLFVDSDYSISDAIRINDIWNEVKVTHQNWGEKIV